MEVTTFQAVQKFTHFHSCKFYQSDFWTNTISTLMCLKAASTNLRTLCASPVEMTKSSGSGVWSIKYMA